MHRLRRSHDGEPGIERIRRGRGFGYRRHNGTWVRDPAALKRIRALAIPPAWDDVWICADERGHLQAAGTDAAGRRQYRYHDDWRRRRDTQKFARIEAFAAGLPALRDQIEADLRLDGLPRARVLACAARLLDEASFRIGSESYASSNGSFGLATLRRSHVTLSGDEARFDYRAKSGRRRVHTVHDPQAISVLRLLVERSGGGRELLVYREGDAWRDVRSADINGYLKGCLGDGHSAKDFRTWQATVLAGVEVATQPSPPGRRAQEDRIRAVIERVAEQLGNTPAVCRASYIDPRVFERFREGITIAPALDDLPPGTDLNERTEREAIESAVLQLLRGELTAEERAA